MADWGRRAMETKPSPGPHRVQQRRTAGWRKPENTVSVARPGKWGNPWRVWRDARLRRWVCKADHNASSERYVTKQAATDAAVAHFKAWAWHLREDLHELRGKNLMCFCPLDQPCHADVLIELANGSGHV